MNYRHAAIAVTLLGALAPGGCSKNEGPDSNTQVFQTPEQAAAVRRQKLLVDWQEMASKIANAERPDVKTMKAEGFALRMSADGIERSVDLTPLTEALSSAIGREREPIRTFLLKEFAALDRERVKKLGFAGVKGMLFPRLANMKQTEGMSTPESPLIPITNPVVLDLNWVPVVRWLRGTEGGAWTPIDPTTAVAWKVSEADVNGAAMTNLRAAFAKDGQAVFETIDLPGLGRYGHLRADADPTYVLLPEFLAAVRKAWGTDSDLVVSMPSPITVNFVERKNERLLNQMLPEWQKLYGRVTDPMLTTPLLVGNGGVSLLNYKPPSTKPVTKPATTKKVYIVD